MSAAAESAPDPRPPLEDLATLLLDHRRRAKAFEKEILGRLEEEGAPRRVDVPGIGHVSYVAPSASAPIDGRACAAKLVKLGAQLRAAGVEDVDDELPLGKCERRASLRVTLLDER